MKCKKLIALSMATILTTQSVNAAGLLEGALNNATAPQSITIKDKNGKTVSNNFYTGGYYLRFNKTAQAPLAFNVSAPAVEVGCNGLNLKGMFVSLLGIDQFGAMLQNAGASLAWGIAIGLVYSLPGVGNVFKMLNQWAHDLQKILGNACSSGIAIGQAIASKTQGPIKEWDNKVGEYANTLSPENVLKNSQNGDNGKTKNILGIEGLDGDILNGLQFGGSEKVSSSARQEILLATIRGVLKDNSIGGAIMNSYLRTNFSSTFRAKIGQKIEASDTIRALRMSLTYRLPTASSSDYDLVSTVDEITAQMSIEERDAFDLKLLSYAIFYNVVGDIGYDTHTINNSIKSLNGILNGSSAKPDGADAGNGKSTLDNDKELLAKLKSPDSGLNNVASIVVGNAGAYSTENLSDFLEFGDAAKGGKTSTPMYAPNFSIIVMKEKDSTEKSFFMTASEPNKNVEMFEGTGFIGVQGISQCTVYNALKTKLNATVGLAELQKVNGVAIDCSKYNAKLGNTDVLADTIGKADLEYRQEAIERLVKIHKGFLKKAILDSLESNLNTTASSSVKEIVGGSTTISSKDSISPSLAALSPREQKLVAFHNVIKELRQKFKEEEINDDFNNSNSEYFKNLQKTVSETVLKATK